MNIIILIIHVHFSFSNRPAERIGCFRGQGSVAAISDDGVKIRTEQPEKSLLFLLTPGPTGVRPDAGMDAKEDKRFNY